MMAPQLDSDTILECRKVLCGDCSEGRPLIPGTWRHSFRAKPFGIPQTVTPTCQAWSLIKLEHPNSRADRPRGPMTLNGPLIGKWDADKGEWLKNWRE